MKTKNTERLFSALANQFRLKILDVLRQGEMSVTEIVRALHMEQSAVSHNLKPLIDVGLVAVRDEGQFRFYSLRAENVMPMFKHLERWHDLFDQVAEDAARESRRRFDLLVRLAPVGIFIGNDRKVTFANSVGAKILGFANSREAAGADIHDFVPRDSWSRVEGFLASLRRGHPIKFVGMRIKRADGKEAVIDVDAAPFQKEDLSAIVIMRDVTKHHELERQVKESEARYRRIFDEGQLGMAIAGPDGKFRRANRNFCRLLGYSERELMRRGFLEVTHPDHRKADLEAILGLVKGKSDEYKTEKRYLTKRGLVIWARTHVSIFRDADGRPVFFQALIEDTSQEKENRDKLLETEGRCRQLVRRGPDVICTVDKAGIILSVQCYQSDRGPKAIVGRSVMALLPPRYRSVLRRAIAQTGRTGRPQVVEAKTVSTGRDKSYICHVSKVERANPTSEISICLIVDET